MRIIDGDSKLKKQHSVSVLNQIQIASDIYQIELKALDLARQCQAGQFVHLKVSDGIDPLLRRPFSIHRRNLDSGTITLLYRVVGKGTQIMHSTPQGCGFDILGPLGNPFELRKNFSHALIVAGGMGIAPVFFLIDALLENNKSVELLWGTRKKEEFFQLDALRKAGVQIHLATEDGSMGHSGLVTELIKPHLENHTDSLQGFACGPYRMLKEIQCCIKDTDSEWQVSMEERMACGVGVCQGCAVSTPSGFKMVCSDGPIFNLSEIQFHE